LIATVLQIAIGTTLAAVSEISRQLTNSPGTMRIALKIVAVCLVAMVLITALSSYLIARREFHRVKEQQQNDATRIGDLIRESVDLAYSSEGHQGIIKAIKTQAVESGHLQYRWVWFDVSANDPTHPAATLDSLNKILNGEMDSVVTTRNGKNNLNTYYPIDVNDPAAGKKRKGAIEVTDSLETAEQESWRTIKTGLGAMAAMTIFCIGFVSWAGIRMIGQPLAKLIELTRQIGNGVYDKPLQLQTKDEFGELALALNTMGQKISQQQHRIEDESAARISAMQQLRHADRLKTVGRLAAGIAHEIGTPLNVVSGRAGLIRSGKLSQQELEESAAAIQSESNRIAGIVRQLMDFARHNPPKRTSTDLRVLIERTIELLKTLAAKNGVTLELKIASESPFTAFADESQIQQVLTNLIMNAIQAMPDGGNVEIQVENVQMNLQPEDASAPFVQIEIRDQGTGMDAETLDQVFEPFFTTKEVGQGTGLGLSIAHGIVEEHAGRIEVESEPDVGTTFRVLLPKVNFEN
jgi:signal transduction histidine kinase